jgi:hypothetical protein
MLDYMLQNFVSVRLLMLVLLYGRKIPEIFRDLGSGPGGRPPTHPLPVTSPGETSRRASNRPPTTTAKN